MPQNKRVLITLQKRPDCSIISTLSQGNQHPFTEASCIYLTACALQKRQTDYVLHFFFTGSQVSPTPSFLNILRSTSDSITVECT